MTPTAKNDSPERSRPPSVSRLYIPELEYILEAPKGEIETYGATPLDRMVTLTQQIEVRIRLQGLTYGIFGDTPLEVADYIHRTFAKRFASRGEANEENFITALHYEDYESILNEDELAIVERARFGKASPAELILVRELLQMKSIELACLTHPYAENIGETLEEMHFAVKYATELFGGEYFDEPETIFKVKESLADTSLVADLSRGVLMTRKRTTGMLADGTYIRERSSFVLRTDPESGFDQAIIARLDEAIEEDPTLDWKTWLIDNENIDVLADQLLDCGGSSRVIAISTTIYAFNKKTAELVAHKKQKKDAEHLMEVGAESPELFDALYNHLDEHRLHQAEIALRRQLLDLSGIQYVGARDDEELNEYLRDHEARTKE